MQSRRPPRLPSARFEGLTKADVEAAIARYRSGKEHKFSDSIRYDLLFRGERYPPKAIFGLAAERIVGRQLNPADFAGGAGSVCFRTFLKLGYTVVPKLAIEELPDETVEYVAGELPEIGFAEPHIICPLAPHRTDSRAPRVGSRRLSRRAKEFGDRAEESVFKQLAVQQAAGAITGLRWLAKEGLTPGWDIEYDDLPSHTRRRIEVKGALATSIGAFDLTANELNAALEHGKRPTEDLVGG